MSELTHEEFLRIMHYDPLTGNFSWKIDSKAKPQTLHKAHGRTAACWIVAIPGRYGNKMWRRPRLAWFYMTGEWPTFEIDHRDGDSTNDRWDNLRHATRHQNEVNKKRYRNNRSGFKGVWIKHTTKSGPKYESKIMRGRKRISLGLFQSAEEAAQAYAKAAASVDGEFFNR